MSNYYCYEKNHSFHYPVFFLSVRTVADPDLQIRGGGHPDPEIRGGPGVPPNFFWPFRPHFGQKMGGGGGSPLDLPLLQSHHNPLYIKHFLASDRTHWLPVGCEEYDDDDYRHHHGHHLHHHHDTLFY